MTISQAMPKTTLSPASLLALLGDYVDCHRTTLPLADPAQTERSYALLELSDDLEIWAIHWPHGQGLELHDHGGSSGGLWVVEGSLSEHGIGADGVLERRTLSVGAGSAFGPTHVHDVVNRHAAPATSVHVYSPPMPSMTFYRAHGTRLVTERTEYRDDPAWAP
jgi:hypothetical protein